jgi:hypothetical protein
MQSALLRLGLVVVFAALLLAVMYIAVQYWSGPAAVILYDQYDTPNWWGPPGDSEGQAADDFVIPAGQAWVITQVDVEGIYWDNNFGGNEYRAKSVNVELYQDDDALPGARIYAQNNISYTLPPPESTEPKVAVPLGTPVPDVHSSFVIRIAPITLTSGPYWLSVWANMPDWQEGHLPRWVWVERLATANHPAAFRSGAGFGGCGISIWGHIGDCINTYSDSSEVDMVFRLRGTILTTKSPSAETPTTLIPSITPTNTPTQFEPTGTPASLPPSATSTPTNMSTSTPEVSPTCTPTATQTLLPKSPPGKP